MTRPQRRPALSVSSKFLEMVAAKLRGRCNGELGDGVIFRLCRGLQHELLIPPLESHHGNVKGVGKYAR